MTSLDRENGVSVGEIVLTHDAGSRIKLGRYSSAFSY